MLHLIFQSPFDSVLLQRIAGSDDVVFLENATFQLNKQGLLNTELQKILKNGTHLYVLGIELETRGIQADELDSGIKVIDYSGLVELTEKNKLIRTWN